MVFSMVVSDFFFRYQTFKIGDFEYRKGRGFAFEEQLDLNTGNILKDRIIDYKEEEFSSSWRF